MNASEQALQEKYVDYRARMAAYPPQEDFFLPSLIPVAFFPIENIESQQKALMHSSQLASFSSYRERVKDDPWNPSYHFYSPGGKLNNPNGLCFWNGYYHLFYQVSPNEDPRPHWGHIYSDDMVHWKDLPLALYPDERSYAPWSGNTVVEDDRVIAMYRGRWAGNCIAVSSDPLLLNWHQLESNPVIPLLPDRMHSKGIPYNVFDPFIWKEGTDYFSLSGIYYGDYETRGKGIHNQMVEHLFHSQDLEHWTYIGELTPGGFPQIPLGNDGACPYFLPLDNRYILFFFSHKSGAYAIWGDYNKVTHRFTPDRIHQFNFGPVGCSSYQAPCAMSDGNGGVYLLFNATDGDRSVERQGVMSVMYHLTLGNDNQLRIAPIDSLSTLHGEYACVKSIILPSFEEKLLPISGQALDLQLQFRRGSAHTIRIELLKSKDGREHTDILLRMPCVAHRPNQAYLTIDTTYSSLKDSVQSRIPENSAFYLDTDESINVRILLDRCTLEVFVNNRIVLMQMVYPSLSDSKYITLTSLGGSSELIGGDIWQMNCIY